MQLRLSGLLEGAEPLPSIDGGMCPLQINDKGDAPCGACKAICPARELRDLLSDYFGTQPADETDEDIQFRANHWNVPESAQSTLKFIIASLPDPVHTHMALLFDRKIETIQRSAQANGDLVSRAWMPWDISSQNESPDFALRLAQTKYRDHVESLPGLMIFHKSKANSDAKVATAAPTELSFLFSFCRGRDPYRRITR